MKRALTATVLVLTISLLLTACGDKGEVKYNINAKAITAFSFTNPAVVGCIDETAKTVFVIVPQGTNVTSLIATFTMTGTSVRVGSVTQISGTTPNDFTVPVTYTVVDNDFTVPVRYPVVDNDGSTADYTVTVISSVINLPRTGQTISYAAGDDGALQKGVPIPSSRFSLSGQTITDALTGLMWARYANTPAYGACAAGKRTWQGALDYIVCLNANSYMSHTDWRLPNKNELRSLVDYSKNNLGNYLQTAIGGSGFINPSSNHWSSTTNAHDTTGAWFVNFSLPGQQGYQDIAPVTNTYDVWPVRDDVIMPAVRLQKTGQTTSYYANDDGAFQHGIAWPSPRFINADGTPISSGPVIDKLTGLMWTQDGNAPGPPACSPASQKTWQQALDYVACLNVNNYLGYSDWRLPNINELDSIFNNASWADPGYNPWPNAQGFVNVQFGYYWTSTTYAVNTSNAWYMIGASGVSYKCLKTDTMYVWPVRGGY